MKRVDIDPEKDADGRVRADLRALLNSDTAYRGACILHFDADMNPNLLRSGLNDLEMSYLALFLQAYLVDEMAGEDAR